MTSHRLLPALAATLLLSTTACTSGYAQYRVAAPRIDDRAYRNGFADGRDRGETDARRGRSYDVGHHDEFRDADRGYGGYGSRNDYRQAFRDGFRAGYDEGYRRLAREVSPAPQVYARPDAGIYRSVATDIGYRDGYDQGLKDGRDAHRFDPQRASRYRSADHEYNGRYGPKDDYRREYRAAFQQGYEQGYRQYRR